MHWGVSRGFESSDVIKKKASYHPHLQTVCSHHSISGTRRSLCYTSNNIISVNVSMFLEEKLDLVTTLKNTKVAQSQNHGANYCFSLNPDFGKLNTFYKYLMTHSNKTVMARSTKTNSRKHKPTIWQENHISLHFTLILSHFKMNVNLSFNICWMFFGPTFD